MNVPLLAAAVAAALLLSAGFYLLVGPGEALSFALGVLLMVVVGGPIGLLLKRSRRPDDAGTSQQDHNTPTRKTTSE